MSARRPIPRRDEDDYTTDAIEARRSFIGERTGAELQHVYAHSIDPRTTRGNIEQFLGVAQVPIGVAGPLLVDGEHAQGEFYVPLATTEGTLVASYNRGMRLLHEAGGVTTTVIDDRMQRAPVFVFPTRARRASSASGCASSSTRSRRPPRRPPDPGACRTSSSTPLADAVHAFRLHDRRRRRPEHDRQGDPGGLPLDRRRTTRGSSTTSSRVELRDRQEELAGQHAAHAWQARRRRGDDPGRAAQRIMRTTSRALFRRAAAVEPRRVHGRREQQRRALGERDHGAVHRDRTGRRQRRRILGRRTSTPSATTTATTTTRSRSRR